MLESKIGKTRGVICLGLLKGMFANVSSLDNMEYKLTVV